MAIYTPPMGVGQIAHLAAAILSKIYRLFQR